MSAPNAAIRRLDGLTATPLGPDWVWIAALALIAAALLAGALLWRRPWPWRLLGGAGLAFAIANLAAVIAEREPIRPVAALIVDGSASMELGTRRSEAEETAEALRARIEAAGFETRLAVARGDNLLAEAQQALADTPQTAIAGAVLITDGQAHALPDPEAARAWGAPVHSLVVGDRTAGDRRVRLVSNPIYAVVGEVSYAELVVEHLAGEGQPSRDGELADVLISVDGGEPIPVLVEIGERFAFPIEPERAGPLLVTVEAPVREGELTPLNNRLAFTVNGVRDRLRVLLITGEPHPGARTWRDILKADPSVDLVHFTILRPPEKTWYTPSDELSLIRFPVDELFVDKLDSFDLVIFDRYVRRGVLPPLYLQNVADYVEDGGSVLVAAGPAYAGPLSLHRTPLAAILPARPTGEPVLEAPFRPTRTQEGLIHPITAALARTDPQAAADPSVRQAEGWGRWFRRVPAQRLSGAVLMDDGAGGPVLLVDRVGDGRVAQILSDQFWLWARDVDQGGPHGEMLRRLAHWLMKEPELEEERLSLSASGDEVLAERRSLMEAPDQAVLTTPAGDTLELSWTQTGPGRYEARAPAELSGLYQARTLTSDLAAAVYAGPDDPGEFADPRARLEPAQALAAALDGSPGGGAFAARSSGEIPGVRSVRPGTDAGGRRSIGLVDAQASRVLSQQSAPLIPPLALALMIMALLAFAWLREGR